MKSSYDLIVKSPIITLFATIVLLSLFPISQPARGNPTPLSTRNQNRSLDEFSPIIAEMVDSVSQEHYTDFMQTLVDFETRNTFHDNCDSAAAYILSQFESFGLDTAYYDDFEVLGHTGYNVIGEKIGLMYPDSIFFITAHYDATAGDPFTPEPIAPGACDNASGSACVLECARVLANYYFEYGIRFVLFSGHENGGNGSYTYVNELLTTNIGVAGSFNFDMISYTGLSALPLEFRCIHNGDPVSQIMAETIAEAAATFVPDTLVGIVINDPSASTSDHGPFWNAGLPASFTHQEGLTYPWYHSIYDTVGNNDLEYATNITSCGLAALAEMADPLGDALSVSGGVSGAWTLENSPYSVVDSIWVPDDSTLTIEPGVFILFENPHPFKVLENATLHAVGTVDMPIVFAAFDPETGWQGIRFLSASNSSRLEFCHLKYGNVTGSDEDAWGGSIYCDNSSPTIAHCVISNCSADKGGAIACVNQSSPVVEFCTLSANSAGEGGALYCVDSDPIVTNCILWADVPDEIVLAGSSNPEFTYCDIQGGWIGEGNIDVDPLFSGPDYGDYHLLSEAGRYSQGQWVSDSLYSPCIDAGDPTSSYDLEPEPNGDLANIGAFGNTLHSSLSISDPHYAVGAVSGTWTAAQNSPMYVYASVYIPQNDTLIIEAGVDVIFLDYFTFEVQENATLKALGTAQDSVTFSAADTAGWQGIRFLSSSDSSRLEYCHLTGSQALGNGGAIYAENTYLSIQHCRIDNCSGFSGGAVYCSGSNVSIRSNLICDNESSNGGGMSFWSCGGEVHNNVICRNAANGPGGGIYLFNLGASPILQNNTISENSATQGGGVYNSGSVAATLINSIIWENSPEQIFQGGGPAIQVSYCDVQNGWEGEGNIDADPLFSSGPLSEYHLAANSPCIDAGNPDPQYDDPQDPVNPGWALWPAQGSVRNDLGAYGGPGAVWPVLAVKEHPVPATVPITFKLRQNYPNPFNAATVIGFELPVAGIVKLDVFDIRGRNVGMSGSGTNPTRDHFPAGYHEITFDGSGLASGIYLYRLEAMYFSGTGKMVLLK